MQRGDLCRGAVHLLRFWPLGNVSVWCLWEKTLGRTETSAYVKIIINIPGRDISLESSQGSETWASAPGGTGSLSRVVTGTSDQRSLESKGPKFRQRAPKESQRLLPHLP